MSTSLAIKNLRLWTDTIYCHCLPVSWNRFCSLHRHSAILLVDPLRRVIVNYPFSISSSRLFTRRQHIRQKVVSVLRVIFAVTLSCEMQESRIALPIHSDGQA